MNVYYNLIHKKNSNYVIKIILCLLNKWQYTVKKYSDDVRNEISIWHAQVTYLKTWRYGFWCLGYKSKDVYLFIWKKNALTLAGLGCTKKSWLITNLVLGALNINSILSTPLSGSLAPMISILKHIKIISVIKLVDVLNLNSDPLVWPIWQHSENIFILYIFLVVGDRLIALSSYS